MEEQTYEQILDRMESVYAEEAGFVPEASSDLGIRLRVLAGEVYNLQSGIQWLKRQSFPQTAEGEFLDDHAAQRGLTRKEASLSAGTLTFSRANAVNYALTVPKGTICALGADPAVRFVTTEEAVLPAEMTAVTVPAAAEQGGAEYNAAAGTITQMVTPPVGFEAVTNAAAFTGGAGAESDDQLRRRLQYRFANRSNGTNKAFYTGFALNYDGVYSANTAAVEGEIDSVVVYVCGRDGIVPSELRAKLQEDLNVFKEINVRAAVLNAEERVINIACAVTPSAPYTLEEIKPACEDLLREFITGLYIGEKFMAVQAMQKLMNAGLICNYKLSSSTADVQLEENERAVCGTVTLTTLA